MDYSGFKLSTMAGGPNYFQLDDVSDISSYPPKMNTNEPPGIPCDATIFDEMADGEITDELYGFTEMINGPSTEMKLPQPTSTFPGNPAADNVSNTAAQTENPMYSNLCRQEREQPCLMNQKLQQVIQGHDDQGQVSSSTGLPPTPAQTVPQTWIGTEDQSESDMTAQQLQATDASSAGPSTKRRKSKVKKPKAYERKTPYEDEKQERRRLNSIKAKEYREKKKRDEDEWKRANSLLLQENSCQKQELMEVRQENSYLKQELTEVRQEISRLMQELMRKQDISRQNQELMEKQEISHLKQELLEKQQEISRQNQELKRCNQWLNTMCQLHQQLEVTKQKFTG